MTIKEAMKRIDFLEKQLEGLLQYEELNSYITYGEDQYKENSDYDFKDTTSKILNFQSEILALRKAINIENSRVLIGIDNYTISDGLVKIALLHKLSNRYLLLSQNKQKSRETSFSGQVEFSERLYDVNLAHKLYLETVEEIFKFQTAIDKANILSEITLDDQN